MQKILWIIPVLILFLFITAPNAHADSYSFAITGDDSGNISVNVTGGVINAISGTFDGDTITSLLAPGTFGDNDNLFFTTPPLLDFLGVSFTLNGGSSGNFDVNLFSDLTIYSVIVYNTVSLDSVNNGGSEDTLTLTSTVPELNPTTGTSAIALLACAVLIIRGRRRIPTPIA